MRRRRRSRRHKDRVVQQPKDRQGWAQEDRRMVQEALQQMENEGPSVTQTSAYSSGAGYRGYLCNHWGTRVELLEGLSVFASGWFDKPVSAEYYGGKERMDLGLYFDSLWDDDQILATPGLAMPSFEEEHPFVIMPWTDRYIPRDMKRFRQLMEWALKSIKEGKSVEFGCLGGHGRTGTAIACLLVLQGMPAWEAARKVWDEYCEEAIEGPSQRRFIDEFEEEITGEPFVPNPNGDDDWYRRAVPSGNASTVNKTGTTSTYEYNKDTQAWELTARVTGPAPAWLQAGMTCRQCGRTVHDTEKHCELWHFESSHQGICNMDECEEVGIYGDDGWTAHLSLVHEVRWNMGDDPADPQRPTEQEIHEESEGRYEEQMKRDSMEAAVDEYHRTLLDGQCYDGQCAYPQDCELSGEGSGTGCWKWNTRGGKPGFRWDEEGD